MSQSRSSDSRSVGYISATTAPHKRIADHLIHQLGGEIIGKVQPGNRREFHHIQPDNLLAFSNQLEGTLKIIPIDAARLWRAYRWHRRWVEGVQIDGNVHALR